MLQTLQDFRHAMSNDMNLRGRLIGGLVKIQKDIVKPYTIWFHLFKILS